MSTAPSKALHTVLCEHERIYGQIPQFSVLAFALADSEARAVEAETALLRQLYASEKQAKVERGDMFCECQDALAALRERVRVLEEANTWQDKSNAPIERTRVLATCLGVYEPCVGSISDSRFYPDGQSGSEPFTHWMPLPTLAATSEHAKEGSK